MPLVSAMSFFFLCFSFLYYLWLTSSLVQSYELLDPDFPVQLLAEFLTPDSIPTDVQLDPFWKEMVTLSFLLPAVLLYNSAKESPHVCLWSPLTSVPLYLPVPLVTPQSLSPSRPRPRGSFRHRSLWSFLP